MNKFEQQAEVLNRLVPEMISCVPKEWTKGTLTIDCVDGVHITYKLKNEEEPGTASISEELRDLIDELYVRDMDNGNTWAKAVISYQENGDDLECESSFDYLITRGRVKPFWKFW